MLFQTLGILIAEIVQTYTHVRLYENSPDEETWTVERYYYTHRYFIWENVANISLFFFLVSKLDEDCFRCYSKVKNVRYSEHQFKQYIYTEKMLRAFKRQILIERISKRRGGH